MTKIQNVTPKTNDKNPKPKVQLNSMNNNHLFVQTLLGRKKYVEYTYILAQTVGNIYLNF